MNKLSLWLIFLVMGSPAFSAYSPEEEEAHYWQLRNALDANFSGLPASESLSDEELKLALDAIEDRAEQGLTPFTLENWMPESRAASRSISLHLRWWRILAQENPKQKFAVEEAMLLSRLGRDSLDDPVLATEILRSKSYFSSPESAGLLAQVEAKFPEIAAAYSALTNGTAAIPSAAEIRAVYAGANRIHEYEGGAYANSPRIYLFCRTDRRYPCLFTLKDSNNRPVRRANGQLWTQPALALSAHGLAFDRRNGNTPSGVYQVDGVMPSADQTSSFGLFRRLILNFPQSSSREERLRLLLPQESAGSSWWREVAIARDVGRSLLRVHGTGSRNDDRNLPYYTHLSTLGCVSQRELTYDGINYRDQRNLLDGLMVAMGNSPQYSNETLIRAILYVVPIDAGAGKVTSSDLANLGIQ